MPFRKFLAALSALSLLAVAALFSRSSAQPESRSGLDAATQDTWQAFGGIHPRLSPDGTQIVCSWQGAICKIPRQGGRIVRLTQNEGFDHEPVWSGDGQRIAFIAAQNVGGGPVRLISSADGQEIDLPAPVSVVGVGPYYKLEYHPTQERLLGLFRQAGRNFGLAWYDLSTGRIEPVIDLDRGSHSPATDRTSRTR
jgi:WD40-like Beta Propeller Repeat